MEVFNVMKAGDKYISKKDGKEKTSWNPVGKLIKKENGTISLFLNLTSEWYSVFPDNRDDTDSAPAHAGAHADTNPTTDKRSGW